MKYVLVMLSMLTFVVCIVFFLVATNLHLNRLPGGILLVESYLLLILGAMMSLGIKDTRIMAVLIFLFGEGMLWWNWSPTTELMEIGKAMGIIGMFIGFIWGYMEFITTDPHPKTWRNSW